MYLLGVPARVLVSITMTSTGNTNATYAMRVRHLSRLVCPRTLHIKHGTYSYRICDSHFHSVTSKVVGPCHSSGAGFDPRLVHVGCVVDEVALGQVFSEYFGFPCQSSFHRLLQNHHLPSGAGTIGQIVADVPSGLSLTPPRET
jgi:hypothetical protein